MLTLFASHSPCSMVVTVALEKARVEYKLNRIDIDKLEHESPEYLKVNPKGRVPSLLTPDGTITEALGIIFYLHKKYPVAQILPRSLTFIESTCFLSWIISHIQPHCMQYCNYASGLSFDALVLKNQAEGQLKSAFEVIQKRLKNSMFWCEEDWSVLDVYLYCMVRHLKEAGFDFSAFGRITEHYERLTRIPVIYRAQSKDSLY